MPPAARWTTRPPRALVLLIALAACGNNSVASKVASLQTSGTTAQGDGTPPDPAVTPPPREPSAREPASLQPVGERVVTRATRAGVTTSTLVLRPSTRPTHVVVLLAGGSGKLGLSAKGLGSNAHDNFLIRTREQFAAAGFVVAVVDAPSDRPEGLEGFRGSSAHADDLGKIVSALRDEFGVEVWIVGTSRGAISAANAAARLGPRGPDGLILLSAITAGKHETLAEVKLETIKVPTLVVQSRGDGCAASPPSGARALVRRLRHAAIHRLLFVGKASRREETDPCEALTRHGYADIEAAVVEALVAFVRAPA